MENLKKYWWLCLLLVLTMGIAFFVYKHKEDLKTMFLINQQIRRVEKTKSDIQKFEKKLEEIKEKADRWEEVSKRLVN